MKTSTLFLGFTLVVLAAVLAALWQAFGPHPVPHPRATGVPPAAEAPVRLPPVDHVGPNQQEKGVRSVDLGTRPSASSPPLPETLPPAVINPPTVFEPKPVEVPTAPPPAPDRSAALAPPGTPTAGESPPADATAVGEGIDLNTASADALNNLGAGKIAKTIIANRPYTTPDDLLTRRVLKRKDYDTIKSRVVVR